MKKKFLSILLILVLACSFSLVPVAPVGAVDPAVPDREAAILAAADRLVEMQNLDGGFTWKVDPLATTGPGVSGINTLGITAMGILKAHELLDKPDYETALAKAYGFAYRTLACKYFPDVTFLIGLADACSDASLLAAVDAEVTETTVTVQSILDLAKARWDAKLIWGGGDPVDPVAMANFYFSARSTLAFWDLEAAVKAGLALEPHFPGCRAQAEAIAGVMYDNLLAKEPFDVEDTTDVFYALALSGAIEGFSELGAYPTITRTMTGLLIANQNVGGYWDQGGDAASDEESVQASTYAVMALIAQGDADAVIAARKCADWFVTIQTETGGWYPGYVGATLENLEVDSEAAWALATAPTPVTIDTKGYYSIQSAIDSAATDDIINVAAGTYNEAVSIDKGLTLRGAKFGVDARTRDTASGESILDGTGLTPVIGAGALNILDGVSGVVIDGFEVCNYESANDGGGSAVLAYSYNEANQGLSQVTIQNNYLHDIGWNGVCVWSNNAVVQDDFTIQFNLIEEAPYAAIELTNVTNSAVLDNKIVAPTSIVHDPGDAGVGIEVAVRAQAGQTIVAGANVTVEGNYITGAFPAGPSEGISRAGINLLSRTYASDANATLSGVTVRENAVSDGGANLRAGILVVAESRLDGPATVTNLLIENNPLDGNACGIQVEDFIKSGAGPATHSDISITGNDIYNSTETAVAIASGTSASGIAVNYNNMDGNAYGIKNNTGLLDAENNYWGNASGPADALKLAATGYTAYGNAVSGNVNYQPWLLKPVVKGQPLPLTYDKTLALKDGWTLISIDKLVVGLDTSTEVLIYSYSPASGYEEVLTLWVWGWKPVDAVYIKTDGGGGIGIKYIDAPMEASFKNLEAGWNLISSATDTDAKAVLSPLRYIQVGEQQGVGLTTLVSQGNYNQFTGAWYVDATTWENISGTMSPCDGYWVYMNAAKSFGVIPD